jgi:hypothetical protein
VLHSFIVLTSGERVCWLSLVMVNAQVLMRCNVKRFIECNLGHLKFYIIFFLFRFL